MLVELLYTIYLEPGFFDLSDSQRKLKYDTFKIKATHTVNWSKTGSSVLVFSI